MKILGIIPSRYASTRFPGKPLAMLGGKTMIQRVYEQAKKCETLNEVVVATDNSAIFAHVQSFGGNVVMTKEEHTSGTERCLEALKHFQSENNRFEAVINIQGDEPFIEPNHIKAVAELFSNDNILLGTLVKKITDLKQLKDPNNVKAVVGTDGRALYFSRSVIPFVRGEEDEKWLEKSTFYKHIGLYGYRVETLEKIVALPKSDLEAAESLEQLRWLSNGYSIHTSEIQGDIIGIDTYEDLLEANMRFKQE